MSNGDTARKSHVVRVYQNDNSESDQWIDVERLDELTFTSASGPQYRKKVWKFNWDDHGLSVTKKKIYDPNDEENFIEVPVRKSVLVKEASGEQFQRYRHHFVNEATNKTRKTTSRRVYHHEVKEGYLQEGKPPANPGTYLDSLGEQDMGQYVEVELLDRYWTDQNENRDLQGRLKDPAWQVKKWLLTEADPLLKEPMLETDEVDPQFVPVRNPEDGPKVDPPWRLDPLQNIVNVQWARGSITVAGNERQGSGGQHNFIYRCKMTKGTEEPTWDVVATYTPSPEEGVWVGFEWHIGCVIYASVGADEEGKGGDPTFIAGGAWGSNVGQPARISLSNDGIVWSDVYTGPREGYVYGVCWDEAEQAFYAAARDVGDLDSFDVLLKSSNGLIWSEVHRANIGSLPGGYTNPIIAHGGNKVQDSDGQNVTNAFWGYNKGTETLIHPDPPYNYWSGSGPGTSLKITRGTVTPVTTTATVAMDKIYAVTFAGGIWHACGEMNDAGDGPIGRIVTSVDDGNTWTITFRGTAGNPIRSIAAKSNER